MLSLLLATTLAAAAPPPPCATPAHRAFDFWIGRWTVRATQDPARTLGRSEVVRVDGCALLERWTGAKGTTGHSLNLVDPADGRWHQFWVDSGGNLLRLAGERSDRAMVLASPDGAQRVTWTPLPDGRVRQHWEARDASGAWSTTFDGTYERRPPEPVD